MTVSTSDLSESLVTHRDAIVRYIRGIVRNDAEAEDLAQETLIRAYDRLSTLEDTSRLLPWLYRIATNVTYDHFRQASFRHRPAPLEEDGLGGLIAGRSKIDIADSPRLDKLMEQREMSSCLQGFIANLSDPYRAVILLHDLQGLTNPEIAEVLGVSLATVKIRLHRARAKLRAVLSEGCTFFHDERGVQVCESRMPRDSQDKE